MQKFKKIVVSLLIFIFTFNIVPSIGSVQVLAADDINIISSTTVTVETAKKWAKSKGATDTFINLADLFWKYAPLRGGVNPAVAYVQSAKETGYGKFGGVIDESYHNPCGMKTAEGGGDYDKDAHQKFENWDQGVQAQLDHLALYAGASGYPKATGDTYDPRHFSFIKGKATTVVSLGGNWAPSSTYGTEIMKMYNELESLQLSLSSLGSIDSPSINYTETTNNLYVRGWALNPSGIKEIKIYVNDKFISTTQVGKSRPDVAKVYPNYAGASTSGYEETISIADVENGPATLKIEEIGINGSVKITTKNFNINKPGPITKIDDPASNESITSQTLKVRGWALNYSSNIDKINVYIDNELKSTTTVGKSRPDVGKAYPNYMNSDNSGYEVNVDISNISSGTKTLKVEQVTVNGSVNSTTKQIKINNPDPITKIDNPTNNEVVNSNSLLIRGWSANYFKKVDKINIYIDDVLLGRTTVGKSRPDVAKVYPDYYNSAYSGYETRVDISTVSNGNITLKVEQVLSDGSVSSTTKNIVVNKPAPITKIDDPKEKAQVNDEELYIRGWALNYSSSISKINIYIDNNLIGTTSVGKSRPDVAKVYPEYPNATYSGYETTIDISKLSSGTKTLRVEQVGSDGSVNSVNRTIVINKLDPITKIDEPGNNEIIDENTFKVRGWALSGSKSITKINVYIDGTLMGSTNVGKSRPDVANVYPNYSNSANSGYETTIDITKLSDGVKTLKVEQVDSNGSVNSATKSINISRPKPITKIDEPSEGMYVKDNTIKVRGWALNFNKSISKINIYIDNSLVGSTTVGKSRTDVANVYPNYSDSANSGYETTIDISQLSDGVKTLKVEQVASDGTLNSTTRKINIARNLPARAYIDNPKIGQKIAKGSNIDINGWALNQSGISKVAIYIDNVFMKNATIGLSRPDVDNVYPGYIEGVNSGYSAQISPTGISVGDHTLRIDAYGKDGTVTSVSRSFNYGGKDFLITVDPGHNYGGDEGAVAELNGVKYYERDLNMKVSAYLKGYLEAEGYSVKLTREINQVDKVDEATSLANRVKIANESNSNLFISIHHNAFTSSSAHGNEVYYYKDHSIQSIVPKSKELATIASKNISDSTGFYNRGAKSYGYYVLKNTKMPGILVEGGFMTNPGELASLVNDMTQKKIAKAISDAVVSTFN